MIMKDLYGSLVLIATVQLEFAVLCSLRRLDDSCKLHCILAMSVGLQGLLLFSLQV
jgi:hypothetical protein